MTKDQQNSPIAHRRARRIAAPDPTPEPIGERLRSRGVRIVRGVLLVAGIVAVVAIGVNWQSSDGQVAIERTEVTPASESSAPAAEMSADHPTNLQELWRDRISNLDAKRIKAFEDRDVAALARVNVANSPAQTHDVAIMKDLESKNGRPVSHKTTIHSAKMISGDHKSALVEVVDSRSEYVVTTESMNRTIKRFKANDKATWRVSLENVAGDWLVYSVARA